VTDQRRAIEDILRLIPGYDPWTQAGAVGAELDHQAAADAINWFADNVKHVEGDARGDPFILQPWQAAVVGNLFGWKRTDEKGRRVRRYRRCLLYVPRGNGKTPLASGIVLYAFFTDGEPGAQNYLAAGQREQAGILFRNARGMVDQVDALRESVTIYGGDQHRSLVLKNDPLSFCKVIPAEAASQHGGIPHITVVDELHVQESRDLVDVFETAMSKKVRKQPLLVMITTADHDRPSICNETYEHACRVRDNGGDPEKPGFDPTFLPVIYEATVDEDWTLEETWRRANPNLETSVSLESLAASCRKAQENPAFENAFRRLHLNQRTKQETLLVPMGHWDKCDRPLDLDALEGLPCYGGLDLASREDLASFALVFPLEDEFWAVLSFSWCPEARVVRRANQKFPYDVWSRAGHLIPTDGDEIDYSTIRAKIDELAKVYDIRNVGYDPHGATQFAQELKRDYGDEFVVNVTQTFRNLSAPTKEIVRRVKLHKIIHGGNPVLRWATSNVAAYIDGKIPPGADLGDYLDKVPVMPSKRKSADKIDPFAALVIAVARMQEYASHEEEAVLDVRII
jgi:phage terminase large subunit-like protein